MKKLFYTALFLLLLFQLNVATVESIEPYAVPSSQLVAAAPVVKADERVLKVKLYLESHKSPLAPFAETFVKEADKHALGENWSLVVAIAGVESTFGKHIPRGSYNAWGWGIPTGAKSGIGFDHWEDGIATVTKGLSEKYIARGADTPEKMGRIYAPPSKTWAGNVRFFMKKIEETPIPPELNI